MIITAENNYERLEEWLDGKKTFLICGGSIKYLEDLNRKLSETKNLIVRFSDFQPNPVYESVVKGVDLFRSEACDSIIAVGGGSAMDVAKCIKLYVNMNGDGANGEFLRQEIFPNEIPFLAVPTTAGSGSEATRYAVIYYEGKKQSVSHESCMPGTVLFDSNVLKTLPLYQKKSTMMDALCHAIESFWSVNSTEESKEYSKNAINLIMDNINGYFENTDEGNKNMLIAAHMAGKAINITQTTAGHAMCYNITGKYGIAHGHAAALCLRRLWPVMINFTYSHCFDPRGKKYLYGIFNEIADTMKCESPLQAAWRFNKLFLNLDFDIPDASFEEAKELAADVNPVRLKNNPIRLGNNDFIFLYKDILDSVGALVDRIQIIISERIKDYFRRQSVYYDKDADPERTILDYMDNRDRGIISMDDNVTEFRRWKKQLRRILLPGDKLLNITNFYIQNDGNVVLDFEIERKGSKKTFEIGF